MEIARGIIKKILKRDEETGYLFAESRFETENSTFIAKISCFAKDIAVGDYFVAQGEWQDVAAKGRYPAYKMFRSKTIQSDVPHTVEGMREWFTNIFTPEKHGVTLSSVNGFLTKYGVKSVVACEKNPEILVELSSSKVFRDAILKEWARRISNRKAQQLMERAGVDKKAILSIRDTYLDRTYEVIKKDPYIASRLKNVGFGNVDKIGVKLDIGKNDDRRVSAALVEVLTQIRNDGSTYASLQLVGDRIDAMFGIDTRTIASFIVRSVNSRDSIFDIEERDGSFIVMLRELHEGEKNISEKVSFLLKNGMVHDKDAIKKITDQVFKSSDKFSKFDEIQRNAVNNSLVHSVSILTGGPGTGKSTVSEVIVKCLKKIGDGEIFLCAPTGKAAKRLQETTGENAVTIHRLLEAKEIPGHIGSHFGRNDNNKLPSGCTVLVDEASMIDVPTMSGLLNALPSDGKLILVGDKNQLPSVDAGMVLSDLLTSVDSNGDLIVPSSELVNVYRQKHDSQIAVGAAQIKDGILPFMSNQPNGGLVLYEMGSDSIVDYMKKFVQKVCIEKMRVKSSSIAILSPQSKGVAGTWEINRVLSEMLNPNGRPIPGVFRTVDDDVNMPILRVGDRVMLTENDDENDVMNGDVGTIVDAYSKEMKSGGSRNFMKLFFDCGKEVEYPVSRWRQFIMAYAMTIHKSQGSQYPVVIMPMTMAHESMLDRSLFYTGWTRAKNLLCLIGERDAIEKSVSTLNVLLRNTHLKRYLQSSFGYESNRSVKKIGELCSSKKVSSDSFEEGSRDSGQSGFGKDTFKINPRGSSRPRTPIFQTNKSMPTDVDESQQNTP